MNKHIEYLIKNSGYTKGSDGIINGGFSKRTSEQEVEIKLREKIAGEKYDNYLDKISESHSIPVMDHEVNRFLSKMPEGAIILDVGGCWGWHWRRLAEIRPDVGIIIIDFVRANLLHAQRLLGSLVGDRVLLMHADATELPFPNVNEANIGFDGVWTVQVFQHIPDYRLACQEAYRVLKQGGIFMNYSLHVTPVNRIIYRLFGKKFHVDGIVDNNFYFARANNEQKRIVEEIFGKVKEQYTECFYHPDLRLSFTGKKNSFVGRIDGVLRGALLGRWIARQRNFEARK